MTQTLSPTVDLAALQSLMGRHLSHYRKRPPHYQRDMLESLIELGLGQARNLLDIGGGTGIIAECMQSLVPGLKATAIDVVDRYCPGLSVSTMTYDGQHMPFADKSFDTATLNNVLHHVPREIRVDLLREIRRVTDGPLLIKDHCAASRLDHLRLTALDAIGNIPFGGMIDAQYLTWLEWQDLSAKAGYSIARQAAARAYRKGAMAVAFPNRLEITLRLEPA